MATKFATQHITEYKEHGTEISPIQKGETFLQKATCLFNFYNNKTETISFTLGLKSNEKVIILKKFSVEQYKTSEFTIPVIDVNTQIVIKLDEPAELALDFHVYYALLGH